MAGIVKLNLEFEIDNEEGLKTFVRTLLFLRDQESLDIEQVLAELQRVAKERGIAP